jgi:hypothetical protein
MAIFMKRLTTFIGLGILAFNTFSIALAQGGEVTPSCVTPPSGIVGWWKGDGNAVDTVSGNNGAEQNNTYTDGVVGQAFAFDPENFANGTYTGIQIADQPAYALTNSLTIEGWVRPRGDGYVIFWRGDNRPGLDPYILSMGDDNNLDFGICDANGNSASIETTLAYNQWTHVAATLDGSSGTMSIYTNGVLAAQTVTAIRPFGQLEADQSPGVGIGNLNDGGNNFPFLGDIDEIALYNRALIPAEIQSIYNAGSAGKCDGPFPPGISVQPVGQTTLEGSNVVLSVVTTGTGPFNYQWNFDGKNLVGATNVTLNLANLHPNQSGNYSVIVSTAFGSITSSIVTVTVFAQDILIYNFSATENITTAGQESSIAYSGEMFFIPASTNGTFVGWGKINGKKLFWVNPFSDYLLITIPGSAKRTYTMLGKAGQEIDTNGYPHIWSYLHKGLNTSLTIAKKRQFSFPDTFTTSETHVYPDSQTANMVLIESDSAYTFLPSNTQAANNGGQTMADLVNTLTTSLVRQGYKQQ